MESEKKTIIPKDEIWIKIRGDHGNKTFKLMFQITNVKNPNSLKNTIPFLIFGAKDLPSNLQATIGPFRSQLAIPPGRVRDFDAFPSMIMSFCHYPLDYQGQVASDRVCTASRPKQTCSGLEQHLERSELFLNWRQTTESSQMLVKCWPMLNTSTAL